MNDKRADKQDIAEVLVRYATGIDTRDWDLFRSCWTRDIVAEYDGIATWHGVDEITDSMETSHAEMGHTMLVTVWTYQDPVELLRQIGAA